MRIPIRPGLARKRRVQTLPFNLSYFVEVNRYDDFVSVEPDIRFVKQIVESGASIAANCSQASALGYLYEQGKGVPLDYVNAYAWYKLAVARGDERGRERMKSLSRVMTQQQISEATVRAAQFPGLRWPREGVSNSNGIRSSFAEWR
jgi:TPR repeat protein